MVVSISDCHSKASGSVLGHEPTLEIPPKGVGSNLDAAGVIGEGVGGHWKNKLAFANDYH